MKIEVSNGEILDKYSILVIKKERIKDEGKLANINKEIESLSEVLGAIQFEAMDYERLKLTNEKLWDVEDELRACEKEGKFDDHFISLARKVYILNDKRAEIKKHINTYTGSDLVEEKSYQ